MGRLTEDVLQLPHRTPDPASLPVRKQRGWVHSGTVLRLLEEPRTVDDIAGLIGADPDSIASAMARLIARGRVRTLYGNRFLRAPDTDSALDVAACAPPIAPRIPAPAVAASPAAPRRPRAAPIRDAILAYLSEPRTARQIATHIGRPVPTATGHLARLRQQGLVLRLGYAVYAGAGYRGPGLRLRFGEMVCTDPQLPQTAAPPGRKRVRYSCGSREG